jgi:hypothetical protein
MRAATITTSMLFVTVALVLWRARELFIAVSPPVGWAAIGALLACAATLGRVAARGALAQIPLIMPACAAVMLVALQFGMLSGRRPEAVEQMASLVREHRTRGERVGEYHVFVRNLVYYTGFRQEFLANDSLATEFIRSPERVLIVVRDRDLSKLEALAGVATRRLGEVRYFNTANIKLRSLFAPNPDEDIQRVLLVSNR